MVLICLWAAWLKANKVNSHIAVICINKNMNYSLTIHYVAWKKCCSFEFNQPKQHQQQKCCRSKRIVLIRHYWMFKTRSCLLPWSTLRCNICVRTATTKTGLGIQSGILQDCLTNLLLLLHCNLFISFFVLRFELLFFFDVYYMRRKVKSIYF